MNQKLPVNRAAVDKMLGHEKPLSSMIHEVGLAAVAAELHLSIDDLELDAGDAVEKGAAALFLAGFGPKPVAPIARARSAKGSGRKTVRSAGATGPSGFMPVKAENKRKREKDIGPTRVASPRRSRASKARQR